MTKSPFSSSSAAWKHRRIDPKLDFGIDLVGLIAATTAVIALPAYAADGPAMGLFVTRAGMGDGANLAGIAGADAHCAKLATATGSKGRTWHAYLSTQVEGKRGISVRDHIGQGPWHSAR
jgi:hypothetical protein